MPVAFLGLGVMGAPMAGHLSRAGYAVRVYNRTRERAERWCAQHGGEPAASVAEAVRGAQVVACCLGDDPDVRAVVLGDACGGGALAEMEVGAVLVDHTTASARLAREIGALAAGRGVAFLDAPVSGGQAGAERGDLTAMVGGDPQVLERVRPVLECYASHVQRIGPCGHGQLAKMVNQICIAGIVEGLSEGLEFARAAGLDVAAVVEAVSRGAAGSWQMDARWQTMLSGEFEHGFAVEWMRKDLRIVFEEAESHGVELPVARQVDAFYAEIEQMGGRRWDTSSLIARLAARRAGAARPPDTRSDREDD